MHHLDHHGSQKSSHRVPARWLRPLDFGAQAIFAGIDQRNPAMASREQQMSNLRTHAEARTLAYADVPACRLFASPIGVPVPFSHLSETGSRE